MLLHKTDLARTALADTRSGALSLHQRRILILADGRRCVDDLIAMLGAGILGEIDALLRAGYLAADDVPATDIARKPGRDARSTPARGPVQAVAALVRTGARMREAVSTASPAAQTPAPTTSAAPACAEDTSNATSASRRSLAASKMYVMDLLQMQRDLEMAEARTEIQCAQGEAATVVAVLDGVRRLIPRVSAGMSTRILERLGDILPDPYLPALRALESEITGRPVLAVRNSQVA
jgi:hypothetical protein